MTKQYGPWSRGIGAWALRTEPGKVLSHWLVQSVLYMEPTERMFKVALEGLMWVAVFKAGRRWTTGWQRFVLAAFAAHMVNFLLNGHLWGALKWHHRCSVPQDDLLNYLDGIAERLYTHAAVESVFVYGSLSRSELHPGSDLDIRVLARPGYAYQVATCALVAAERSRALFARVPLDIYVWTTPRSAQSMRADEVPMRLSRTRVESVPGRQDET